MTSQLHVILVVLLLAQLMVMVECVIDVDGHFTDGLPPLSDIAGQYITNAITR